MNYYEYIQSDKWKEIRSRYFKSKYPKRCACCNKPKGHCFQLHHKTYKDLGNEKLSDLVLLCKDCHKKLHEFFNSSKRTLWKATHLYINMARQVRGLHPDFLSTKKKKKGKKRKNMLFIPMVDRCRKETSESKWTVIKKKHSLTNTEVEVANEG